MLWVPDDTVERHAEGGLIRQVGAAVAAEVVVIKITIRGW